MMRSWRGRVVAVACGIAAAAAPVDAQPPSVQALIPGGSEVAEVRLQHADSMIVTRDPDKPQVFQGNVDVVIVDQSSREARLRAMKISIYYLQKSQEVDRLVAEGQVILTRDDLVATTELAVYDGKQNTVDLLEENHIKDVRGELTADRIRVHLETNQVTAEGNVHGVVYPKHIAADEDEP